MPTERTVTYTLYTFDELNPKAKEKAREWFRKDYPDYDYWDTVYSDADTIAALMGIEIARNKSTPEIQFSGFWSQGDGASYTGNYGIDDPNYNALAAVKSYAPKDEKLHAIAAEFDRLQTAHAGQLKAKIGRHRGNYVHSNMMEVDAWIDVPDSEEDQDKEATCPKVSWDAVRDNLRALADWIYRQCENEYNYLVSDESVDESMRANEYTFLEDGTRKD